MPKPAVLIEKLVPLWLLVLALVWVFLILRYDPEPAKMFTGHGSKYANPPSPAIQAWIRSSKNKWRPR